MCYVIVTSRTIIWTLLSIVTALTMLTAIVTPMWLIGPKRKLKPKYFEDDDDILYPSLGIFNRCTKVHHIDDLYTPCAPFITSLDQPNQSFPHFWKLSLLFFAIGMSILCFTIITALLGFCVRSICRKSIFTISGTVQAIAGLFFIIAIFCYPFGWGTERVEKVCGPKADPFVIGDCYIGWALYLAIGSTMATFVCAVLSVQAEISTSSDKVQDEILNGKSLICLF